LRIEGSDRVRAGRDVYGLAACDPKHDRSGGRGKERRAGGNQPPPLPHNDHKRRLPRDRAKHRILSENLPLQLLQLRPRLDPQLVYEWPPPFRVELERLCLTTGSIQGENQLAAQALA
jgi:hypothetical protein